MRSENKAARQLIQNKKTVSTAESCTGGLLANRLTNIPGSTKYFRAGLVTYSNESKTTLLKVRASILKKYGAVSRPVADQMARQVRKIFSTDFGIGITGIAGPTGGTKQKPVGLVFIAVAAAGKSSCRQFRFKGTRLQIKKQAAEKALKLLLKKIEGRKWKMGKRKWVADERKRKV